MRFAIAIPQLYGDGEFDPAAFGAYLARVEELGFDSAWAQEHVLGPAPVLGPVETMTYAAACRVHAPYAEVAVAGADPAGPVGA